MYGLNETSLSFMESYINNRYQCTMVNGFMSSRQKLTYGTAQGSILGPLIYILYVNDIFKEIDNDKAILMYADDTLLINSDVTVHDTCARSQEMLNTVVYWCKRNKLTVNIDKTKCMLINPNSTVKIDTTSCHVRIGETLVSRVHVYEYLGVQIDDKLTMNNQIDNMCKKVQKKYGILKKIRKYITRETALCVYKTMIRPHFDYGDYMIDSGTQNRIDKIERIHDKLIRTIEYKGNTGKRDDIDVLRKEYNIESLSIMYKESLEEENIDRYRLDRILRSRKKVKIKTPFTRITKIQKSPFYRGITLWNELPTDLQNEKNIDKFKAVIKKHKFIV